MAYPILAPNSTWYKSSVARSTITQINIVDSYTPTSYDETWNADVGNTGSIKCYRTGTVITMAGNGSGKIAANADSARLFSYNISSVSQTNYLFTKVTAINGLDLIDTSNVTTLQGAFAYCLLLTTLDLSSWDVSNVTNLRMTFGANAQIGEMGLTSINVSSWDTSKVTTMRAMCQCCSALTTLDVSKWDTSSNTDMSYAFYKCSALTILDVSKWDTSEVTTMQQTFARCTSLTALDVSNWDVSKVTTMRSMFSTSDYGLTIPLYTELDVSRWDTSSCTDMGWMFYGCRNLNRLDVSNWDVSNVESLHHFIAHSFIYLDGVENWDVSNCRAFNATFYCCTNASLDLSGWDVSKGVTFSQMFEGAPNLVEIKGLEKWNTSNGRDFAEMFKDCASIKKLDLSSFDTRNASANYVDEWNSQTGGMTAMFYNMNHLEEITFGENFSFNGDGTCPIALLPTTDATYITGADGNWYDENGNAYAIDSCPSGAGTYYAAVNLIDGTYFIRRRTLVAIADAVREKTSSTEKMTPDEIIINIKGISGGQTSEDLTDVLDTQEAKLNELLEILDNKAAGGSGGGAYIPVEEKEVNFYDYDGTILYSYTVEEAQALTSLPPLPSHDGLVCQGWNWTLQGLKSLNRAMNVGAVYITDDGKTRLYLNIATTHQREVTLHIRQTVTNGVTIDWGDGTATETVSGTGNVNVTHMYAQTGRYVVSLDVTSGELEFGSYSISYSLIGEMTDTAGYKRVVLEKVEIGEGVRKIGYYSFHNSWGLEYITIPNNVIQISDAYTLSGCRTLNFAVIPLNVTRLGVLAFGDDINIKGVCLSENCKTFDTYVFSECENIKSLKIPNGFSLINNGVFSSCKAIKEIFIPESATSIGISAFRTCRCVTEITIPSQVSSIGTTAFQYCYGMQKMKFLPTTPPTVTNVNAFDNLPTTCVVEVPKGTLATYQAATNYGGIAAQMVESD